MNNKEAGKSALVAAVLLILAPVHAGSAQPGQAQPVPAEKPPQSTGETLIIGTTALRLGMSKDSVMPALAMQYEMNSLVQGGQYLIMAGKSSAAGFVSFKPGLKAWNRKMTVTAGGQVSIDATLEKEAPPMRAICQAMLS